MNYDHMAIVNYDCKTFIVKATGGTIDILTGVYKIWYLWLTEAESIRAAELPLRNLNQKKCLFSWMNSKFEEKVEKKFFINKQLAGGNFTNRLMIGSNPLSGWPEDWGKNRPNLRKSSQNNCQTKKC